jgi:hypothetical protein
MAAPVETIAVPPTPRRQRAPRSCDDASTPAYGSEPDAPIPPGDPDRAQRARVLTLGALLGLPGEAVILFSDALTGRRWDDCSPTELTAVALELLDLLRATELAAARRRTRR